MNDRIMLGLFVGGMFLGALAVVVAFRVQHRREQEAERRRVAEQAARLVTVETAHPDWPTLRMSDAAIHAATNALIDVYARETMNSASMLRRFSYWRFKLAAAAVLAAAISTDSDTSTR